FDVPTVGLGTLHRLHEAGGKVLAIEAEKTIVVDDREEFCRLADQLKIAVVAVREEAGDCFRRPDQAAAQPVRLHIPSGGSVNC
ncbi:MAG: UDP-2,3-diacylglucosamine diphosphatase LpxI, partial [Pirellulales bacterium]